MTAGMQENGKGALLRKATLTPDGIRVGDVIFKEDFFTGLLDGSLQGHIFQFVTIPGSAAVILEDLSVKMMDKQAFTGPQ